MDQNETNDNVEGQETDNGEPADANVLVAIMNNLRDWELVQRAGWYRIPVRRAPRQMAAAHLAFFHTAVFKREKWSVRYYAPVWAVRLARRRDLLPEESEHPRADDLYYRFDLGPLRELPRPIPSRRLRRVTFIHTTLQRLHEAGDVSQLWIRQPLRERLWVEFNRQGIHAEPDAAAPESDSARHFDFLIPCRRGSVAIDCRPISREELELGVGREGSLPYPPSPVQSELEALRCSWLLFDDPGWPMNLGGLM